MSEMSSGNGSVSTSISQLLTAPVIFVSPTTPANLPSSESLGTLAPSFVPQATFLSSTGFQEMATSKDDLPFHEQRGSVILGPGSKKEALLLGLGLPRLSYRQEDDLENAKKFAMEQSIKHALLKQTVAHQQQQQKMAMYAQALSLMGRVYVGSISFELKEETIKNAFAPFGPLKSVNMSFDPMTGHHKGFAFLEFEVPEAATLAQEQMNGLLMGGRNIKVGRPSNMPQAQSIVEMIKEEAKQFHRIYVASIHPDLTETDVESVFGAFGKIRNIEFAKGPQPGKHRGYAYIDFDTEQAASDAVVSMNLFDLGGQFLRVGRAITPPSVRNYIPTSASSSLPTASAVAAAAVTAKLQAIEATSFVSPAVVQPQVVVATGNRSPSGLGGQVFVIPPPGVAIPKLPTPPALSPATSAGSNSPALFPNEFQPSSTASAAGHQSAHANNAAISDVIQKPMVLDAVPMMVANGFGQRNGATRTEDTGMSRVIVLKNMVGPEDVDETLEDEVAEECSKHGRVDQVVVFQDPPHDPIRVNIFVRFSNPEEAEAARSKLDGRYFSGRQVTAQFYDQNFFDRNDFTR